MEPTFFAHNEDEIMAINRDDVVGSNLSVPHCIKLLLALDSTNAVVGITRVAPANVGVLGGVSAEMVFSCKLGTLQDSGLDDIL